MDTGIGATLRDARNRRKVDLSQVEAATQIRVRYLQAMENEDWDVLPGDVYARGFIRTYASYLGLDGERLAGEYRRSSAGAGAAGGPRVPVAPAQSRPKRRFSGRAWGILVTLGVIALLVALGLSGGDDSSPGPVAGDEAPGRGGPSTSARATLPGIALRLAATGEVWVCLLDSRGRSLVDGLVLAPGTEEGPFRSSGFTVSFGNGEVSMTIDGKEADLPETSSPAGYAIGGDGSLQPLPEGERPTCT